MTSDTTQRGPFSKGNGPSFCESRQARMAWLLATTLFVTTPQIVMPAHAHDGARRDSGTELLPTGKVITPLAIPGSTQQFLNPQLPAYPTFVVSEAVKSELSPDGNTLAIVVAGNNLRIGDPANSTQYLFIYDVSGANSTNPKLMQVIKQDVANVGIVWNGNTTIYASGGPGDEVYVYTRAGAASSVPFTAAGTIALGHTGTATTGGLAVSADGKVLLVTNYANASISVIDTASNAVLTEYSLTPSSTSGQSGKGGDNPWAVTVKANGVAFISSVTDREVVVVDVSTPASPKFLTRIALAGNPYGMTLSADQSKLFVAQENSDQVGVIDTVGYALLDAIDTRAPGRILADQNGNHYGFRNKNTDDAPRYTGVESIAARVSPDGKTLYAVNNGNNSIAVVPLEGKDAYTTTALLPTAYAPKDVTFSADGSQMYIINGRSNTGPNPEWPGGYIDVGLDGVPGIPHDLNQYGYLLERSSLVTAPVPKGNVLDDLTKQVAKNNHYSVQESENDITVMNFLHDKIKHVIYVVKENRTFDQVLGDLNNGANVDPSLTQFGAAITPNLHSLAKNFVTLDNFLDSGDGSGEGWKWVEQGGVSTSWEIAMMYAYRFTTPSWTEVDPGKDAPFGQQKSLIFDAVLNAGGTVRNYGWEYTVATIGPITDANGSPISNPFAAGAVQVRVENSDLVDSTDLYFRPLDLSYSDTWRMQEWAREFQQFEANGQLPSLEVLWLGQDHMGNFGSNVAGLNTPEQQQADNDFAVGKLIETVAHSQQYANNTLVMVIEDDTQDGPDHIDSHRSTTYIAGPYVKQGAVVSTFFSQADLLRTIEDILGTEHMNLNTAYARPMSDVFDVRRSSVWTFNAVASTALQGTGVQVTLNDLGAKYAEGPVVKSTHDAFYWDEATRGFDFSDADRVPTALYNKVLWAGLMGDKPYPTPHSVYEPVVRDDDDDGDVGVK